MSVVGDSANLTLSTVMKAVEALTAFPIALLVTWSVFPIARFCAVADGVVVPAGVPVEPSQELAPISMTAEMAAAAVRIAR
jgi:hypothetical protein